MIHCINCGHVNADGASHCEACFEALPAVTSCPTCQATVPDDAFFCPQCGASLPRGVANQPDAPFPEIGSPPSPVSSELPPTNVVVQQSFGTSTVPPTDVVQPSVSNELPPTNVVNPPVSSELPPTNVVNPLPETMPPQAPGHFPADIPPTFVVDPLPHESNVSASITDSETPDIEADSEPPNEIETVPTMVVSPGVDRTVEDDPLPPPPFPSEPTTPPMVPPTMPPQAPPTYQTADPKVSDPVSNKMQFSDNQPIDKPTSSPPVTLSEPTTEAILEEDVQKSDADVAPSSIPVATTVQPSMPMVGETIIQKPPALLIHERSNTILNLPMNLEVVLVGKRTHSIHPDVDVSNLADSDVVSRRHAAIFVTSEGYFIEDLGSSNGTYVNDVSCPQGERMPITPGDRICLGRENKVSFIFQVG